MRRVQLSVLLFQGAPSQDESRQQAGLLQGDTDKQLGPPVLRR